MKRSIECAITIIVLCLCVWAIWTMITYKKPPEIPFDMTTFHQITTVRYIKDGFPDVLNVNISYVFGETENFYKATDNGFNAERYRTSKWYRGSIDGGGSSLWSYRYIPKDPLIPYEFGKGYTMYLYEDGDRVKEGKLCEEI